MNPCQQNLGHCCLFYPTQTGLCHSCTAPPILNLPEVKWNVPDLILSSQSCIFSYLRKIELILNHFLDSTVLNKINHLFHFLLMDLDESYLSLRKRASEIAKTNVPTMLYG